MAVDIVKIVLGLLAAPTLIWILTYFGEGEAFSPME
jgi:hypothetical protein